MAQVFDRNGTYYARFMHNGKDYCRSTKVPVASGSKKAVKEAKERADAELARMLAEVRGRESTDALFDRMLESIERLPESERQPKRITLADRLRHGVTARLAVSEVWQAWLDNPKKRNPSPATIEMYLAYWGRDSVKKHGRQNGTSGFRNWLTKYHEQINWLHEVSPAVAEEYATHLWASGIAPRTYNGAIKFLRSMFTVLKTRAGLATNPWDEMPAQDSETEGRRNFTSEELEKVCAKAEGTLRYWICIGLYTGLRLGDVVTLKWDEIDFRSHRITRRPSKTRRKDKVLTIPLHPVLESMLKELKRTADKGDSHLFAEDAERHQRGQSSTITQRIQEHFRKCGIETTESADDLHRKKAIVRVGFHSLRHSYVSLCAANRVPQVAIQELVGHGSPAMTALYSHAGDEQKEQAIAALPDMSFENAEESEQPRKKTRRRKLAAKPK